MQHWRHQFRSVPFGFDDGWPRLQYTKCGKWSNRLVWKLRLINNTVFLQTGVYSNTVVLQHHSVVMTKADKIYKVKCTYDMSSKNITFGMMPIRDPEMIHINSSPEAPPPRIRILDTRQREVETVRIGDRLNFRIEIPEDSKCNFWTLTFVIRCVAISLGHAECFMKKEWNYMCVCVVMLSFNF